MDEILFEEKPSYFKDGKRKVDFVLVITKVSAIENEEILTIYLRNLLNIGIELEQSYGIQQAVIFVKLHLPPDLWDVLRVHYPLWERVRNAHAPIYELKTDGLGFTETPLTYMDPTKEEDHGGKIFFIHKVLKLAKYGEKTSERGLDGLMGRRIIARAYGLHDGFIQKDLDDDDVLNDRSLLRKYWGNFTLFYKAQPLDFIKNYYGVEIAFYFAFLEFYANMTIIPLILSIVPIFFFISNYYTTMNSNELTDICARQTVLCGSCILGYKCITKNFLLQCKLLQYTIIFDNHGTTFYSLLMSLWAYFVLIMWDKREKDLIKRWNLAKFELKSNERTEFKEQLPYRRKSPLTGMKEGYMPWPVFLGRKILVFTCSIAMIVVLVLALWLNVNLMIGLKIILEDYWEITLELQDVFIYLSQYCFMSLISNFITKFVIMLCDLERHKYQTKYDNEFLVLKYLFRTINQFGVLFYFAIGKGLVYNIPHPKKSLNVWGFLIYDKYQPHNSFLTLLLVQTIRSFCNLVGPVLDVLFAYIKKATKTKAKVILHQYENEYGLDKMDQFKLSIQFLNLMTMHGSLTMFAFANYFAPIFYSLTIFILMRIEAYRFVKIYKRPIPKIIHDLASWRQILKFITYTSILVNSVCLMFSSEIIIHQYFDYEGFFKMAFSQFDMHEINPNMYPNNSICLYRDMRFPPFHTKRYQFNEHFWNILTYQNASIFIVINSVSLAVLISKKIATAIWNTYYQSHNKK